MAESEDFIARVNAKFDSLLVAAGPVAEANKLDRALVEYYERAGSRDLVVLPSLPKPFFVDARELANIKRVTESLWSSLVKITTAYAERGAFSDKIILDDRISELGKLDYGYSGSQITTRFDLFFDGGTMKLLEFSCGDPTMIGHSVYFQNLFSSAMPAMQRLADEYELVTHDMAAPLFDTLLAKYAEFCSNRGRTAKKRPVFAFAIFTGGLAYVTDLDELSEQLRKRGYDTIVCDHRDFEYEDGKVTVNGVEVDIIYRDHYLNITHDTMWADAQPIVQALRDTAVCYVNPHSAQQGAFKSLLEVVSDPKYADMFTEDEQRVHAEVAPWTRSVAAVETYAPDGSKVRLEEFVRDNRNELVLKVNDEMGGKGVYLGTDTDDETWREMLQKGLGTPGSFVVQEFVETPTVSMPAITDGTFEGFSEQFVNFNTYTIDGKYVGAIARTSQQPIINVTSGGGVVPVYYVSPKGPDAG